MTSPPSSPPTRFTWERAVKSDNGPKSSTTRHVLLTLGTHVRRGESLGWPGIRRLERETALSNRAVIDHLRDAVAGGWVRCEFRKPPGGSYDCNVYTLAIPAEPS